MKTTNFHRLFAAALMTAVLGALLSGCRANPVGSGADSAADAALVLTVAGPWTSGGSRLLLGNATWIRVSLSADGATTSYEHDVADASFELSAELGKTYTVEASAGNGTDTALYAASATITVGETQNLDLFLLPVETTAWPVVDSDSYTIAPGALAAQTSVTYRVRLGSAARWYINTATGYGTDLRLYVQNEDGSAVTPSAYAADRLVVERSALADDATSFLLTMYNASAAAISGDVTAMTSLRDAYAGALLFDEIITTIGLSTLPGDMTYLDGKLYVAMGNDSYIETIKLSDSSEETFFDGAVINKKAPWGITTDGVDLFIAFQYYTGTINPGAAAKVGTGATVVWTSDITRASGIAVLGNYAYITDNSAHIVYRVLKSSSGIGTAADFVAGSGTNSSTEGSGNLASFSSPAGICSDGNYVYIVDAGSRIIRKVDQTTNPAVVTNFAGDGTDVILDGFGTAAGFSGINHITSDGTYLYVTDANTLRRIEISSRKVETMYTLSFNGGGLVKVGAVFYIVGDGNNIYRVY